ncbi:MAG: FUSC family protein, partial [Actinobacteria bacterium]|nr:FUSC family protein [Actinomycetota bacterium]
GGGWGGPVVALLFAMAVIMYRYFTGNYIVACFGLSGSVLVLDQTLAPDDYLYPARVVTTVLGGVIALIVVLLIPTWRKSKAPDYLRATVDDLRTWLSGTSVGLGEESTWDSQPLRAVGNSTRLDLFALRNTAEAAVIDPRNQRSSRFLVDAVDAAERIDFSLLALTAQARRWQEQGLTRQVSTLDLRHAQESLDRAAIALGEGESAPSIDLPLGDSAAIVVPQSDQDIAVAAQMSAMKQAASELAHACEGYSAERR